MTKLEQEQIHKLKEAEVRALPMSPVSPPAHCSRAVPAAVFAPLPPTLACPPIHPANLAPRPEPPSSLPCPFANVEPPRDPPHPQSSVPRASTKPLHPLPTNPCPTPHPCLPCLQARHKLEEELARINQLEASKVQASAATRMEHRSLLEHQIKEKAYKKAAAEFNKVQEKAAAERAEAQYQATLNSQLSRTMAQMSKYK